MSLTDWALRWQREEPDLLVHDPGGPRECLVRPGELLLPADAVETAMATLDRWVDRVEPAESAATLRLRSGIECVSLAEELGERLPVSVNHVHVGSPILLGTGAVPEPAALPPAPPDELWDPPVTVAVFDSGLDPHPWFAGRRWLSEWGLEPEVLDADDDHVTDHQAGHGTFVTGVLVRNAPGVTVRHRRVLSSQGLTDDRTVAEALRAIRHRAMRSREHVDVLLLSAGCHTADDRCPPVLARELALFEDAVVVAAAGNGGTSRPFWPAASPDVVAVGARAPFSNHGPWVDTIAPGVDVVSSHVQLRTGPGLAPDTEPRVYGAARWSGTSFAAPRIAADVACLMRAGLTAAEARRKVAG